ncbi:28729_t:CDS:1, partial [Dentiscutata erythropus]
MAKVITKFGLSSLIIIQKVRERRNFKEDTTHLPNPSCWYAKRETEKTGYLDNAAKRTQCED